jgi:hypothetical protein
MWAKFQRLEHRHCRATAKFTRRVIRRCQDTATVASGHGEWLAAQGRTLPFFNGGVKTIHVDVDDFSHFAANLNSEWEVCTTPNSLSVKSSHLPDDSSRAINSYIEARN